MAGGGRQDGDSMLRVMARRNLGASVHGGTQEELSQALLHLHTVRLDREGITTMKNLELVKEVQSLYLQENQIKKIENVEVLKHLRFLSLSCNRLEEIRNFQYMTNLLFLDVSQNLIKKLDASELPQSLLILDLTGNPCTKAKDYRQQILDTLPFLQQLDGETVRDSANQNTLSDGEEKEDGSNSEDSDEASLPFHVSGGLSSLREEMIQRSCQRRQRARKEHEERLSELNDAPDKQPLIPSRNDTCNPHQGCSSTSVQEETLSTAEPQNSLFSEISHQNTALVKQDIGTSMPAFEPVIKTQVPASSCQIGLERSSGELNRTSSKKLPPSAPPSKADTGKTPSTVTVSKEGRQALSAPSTRKMKAMPTKNTWQASEKASARHCPVLASSRPQNERQATSATTKKTLQSPVKLPMTPLKVCSNASGLRKKTL
ncbi:leucine-rich repeat-containing protein 46 isoform X2 [Eleutherodactylus coqui]|uniref:leucine-rich repeat-containing protein 46 isoform X2 n=1 Tax=Eleutherodactylus coqui TaxID=57060 RepID=UPI003461FA22